MNGVIGPGFLNQVPTLKGAFWLKIDAASQISFYLLQHPAILFIMTAVESSVQSREANTPSELATQFSLAAMRVGGNANTSTERLHLLGYVSSEQILV